MSTKPKKLSFGGATPEQHAIIHGDSKQGAEPNTSAETGEKPKEKKPPVEKPQAAKPPKTKPSKPNAKKRIFDGPLLNQTYRVPTDLVDEILRASMERKLKKQQTHTLQDIVKEALTEWLAKNKV